MVTKIDHLSAKFIKEKVEDKVEKKIITKVDIKVDTDQIVEIDIDFHIEVNLNMDKVIEKGLSIFKITEEILGQEILEKCKTTEVKILEEDIEVTSATVIWKR